MTSERARALGAIEDVVNRGGEADEVLLDVLAVLGRVYGYAAVEFVEGDRVVLGPAVGEPPPESAAFPVAYRGRRVGALLVGEPQADDRPFLERVATLVSAHVLVGWDTGGVPWSRD